MGTEGSSTKTVTVCMESVAALTAAAVEAEAAGAARVAALIGAAARRWMDAVGVAVMMTVAAVAVAMMLNLPWWMERALGTMCRVVRCASGRGHCGLRHGGGRGTIVSGGLSARADRARECAWPGRNMVREQVWHMLHTHTGLHAYRRRCCDGCGEWGTGGSRCHRLRSRPPQRSSSKQMNLVCCNNLCRTHTYVHTLTLSLWRVPGRRRRRTRCGTRGVQARVRGTLALHRARRAHQGWSSTKRALLPRSLVSVQHSVFHGRM